jgi:hypothetical protein
MSEAEVMELRKQLEKLSLDPKLVRAYMPVPRSYAMIL